MQQNKIESAISVINQLHRLGYIDDESKGVLESKLNKGDMQVFEELRTFLIKIAEKSIKTQNNSMGEA